LDTKTSEITAGVCNFISF